MQGKTIEFNAHYAEELLQSYSEFLMIEKGQRQNVEEFLIRSTNTIIDLMTIDLYGEGLQNYLM